ncbi:hypothetical protein H4CHR_01537 [Variovorax sp. PBS-H4]|uniref:hypothetical protein n=1 Tax=Variovorax sp. PBS-H4 TaxID=434008 RepID=UPI001316CBDC|nr:hypothetical protein [Variovorax sp. PBS-H4]VTU25151.1 hypothetical protein H4CHR_01537 [Variovorax sp. PBS-H4]
MSEPTTPNEREALLEQAAEIAMDGWHSVEAGRAFACRVTDYILSRTDPAVASTAAVPEGAEPKECRHCGWMCAPNTTPKRDWYPLAHPPRESGDAEDAARYRWLRSRPLDDDDIGRQGMTTYKAKHNEIVDQDGKQIAVVMPVNCSMKDAKVMAAFAAQQMNRDERRKAIRSAAYQGKEGGGGPCE